MPDNALEQIQQSVEAIPGLVDERIETLAGTVTEVKTEILGNIGSVAADVEELKDKTKTLDDYIQEVEKNAGKARYGGSGRYMQSDALKDAIPERFRACLDLWSRFGANEEKAVRMTAMETWLKLSLKSSNPQAIRAYGGKLYEEMDALEKAMGYQPVTKAAMEEGTPTEGGYLVPVPIEAEILRLAADASIMRRLVRVVPMTVPRAGYPAHSSGVTVGIVAEEGTIPTSEPTLKQRNLEAKMIAVRALASMQIIQDSVVGIFPYVIELMTEEYGLFEDRQVLEGSGVEGNFKGVVSETDVKSVTNGTNGSFIQSDKFLEQKWKARKRSTRNGAAWVMAPEVMQQIESKRMDAVSAADEAGGFLYTPAGGGAIQIGNAETDGGQDGFIHGFPAYASSEILTNRAVGTSGNVCTNVYFAPWNRAVMLGDLLGLQFGVSEHTKWDTAQLDLRMLKRTAARTMLPESVTVQTGVKTA